MAIRLLSYGNTTGILNVITEYYLSEEIPPQKIKKYSTYTYNNILDTCLYVKGSRKFMINSNDFKAVIHSLLINTHEQSTEITNSRHLIWNEKI